MKNIKDKKETGNSPLHDAVKNGDLVTVIALIDTKLDVNVRNNEGETPLHLSHDYKITQLLLTAGADVEANSNCCDSQHTPLLSMIVGNSVSVVKLLIDAGANVNKVVDSFKNTILHEALGQYMFHAPIIELLLKAGANVNTQNNLGETPLHYAMGWPWPNSARYRRIVQLLFDYGADESITDKNGYRASDYKLSELYKAVRSENIKNIAKILKTKVDVNFKNAGGETSLICAVSCQNINIAIVQGLLVAGANVDLGDEKGNTPLMRAFWVGNTHFIDILLKFGAQVNVQNGEGQTIVHILAKCFEGNTYNYLNEKESISILQILLNHGADINLKDSKGKTPLEYAPTLFNESLKND